MKITQIILILSLVSTQTLGGPVSNRFNFNPRVQRDMLLLLFPAVELIQVIARNLPTHIFERTPENAQARLITLQESPMTPRMENWVLGRTDAFLEEVRAGLRLSTLEPELVHDLDAFLRLVASIGALRSDEELSYRERQERRDEIVRLERVLRQVHNRVASLGLEWAGNPFTMQGERNLDTMLSSAPILGGHGLMEVLIRNTHNLQQRIELNSTVNWSIIGLTINRIQGENSAPNGNELDGLLEEMVRQMTLPTLPQQLITGQHPEHYLDRARFVTVMKRLMDVYSVRNASSDRIWRVDWFLQTTINLMQQLSEGYARVEIYRGECFDQLREKLNEQLLKLRSQGE